jgi:phenylacetate-CoA ligase
VYAEVVGDDGELAQTGEAGRLVLTDLRNYSMPLIRYDTGDIASLGIGCGCERGFPILEKIIGRESEYALTRLGVLPSLKVTDEFGWKFLEYVQAFQFIQARDGRVLVKVVPSLTYNADSEDKVAGFLRNYFADYEVELVTEIRAEPSEKRRIFKAVKSFG